MLLADREFIGTAWFRALRQHGVPHAIRVRNNQLVVLADGRRIKVSVLAGTLRNQRPRSWNGVALDGVPCTLSLKRLPDKDLLAVVGFGLRGRDDPLETCRHRWAIELCFACLKTKGFNIEDTHLRHPDRLEKMFALASIAAALGASESQREKQDPCIRKNATRKKTTATPLAPLSCVS